MKTNLFFILILILVSFLSPADSNPIIGIMDILAGEGLSKNEVRVVTDFVFNALYTYGRDIYTIITPDLRNSLLAEQEFSVSAACEDIACAIEIGRLLSASYMIFGSCGVFGSNYHVNLQLVDVSTSELLAVAKEKAANLDEIETAVDKCVVKLIKLLDPEDAVTADVTVTDEDITGSLEIISYPGGAEVFLDGESMGVTPLLLTLLMPGSYDVQLVREPFDDVASSVTLEAGSGEAINLDFDTSMFEKKIRKYTTGYIINTATITGTVSLFLIAAYAINQDVIYYVAPMYLVPHVGNYVAGYWKWGLFSDVTSAAMLFLTLAGINAIDKPKAWMILSASTVLLTTCIVDIVLPLKARRRELKKYNLTLKELRKMRNEKRDEKEVN